MSFESLGLSPELLRASAAAGFASPTPIQLGAIPPALRGADLLGRAQTGSGKTAAYALPLLQHLQDSKPGPRRTRALVLVPTRELAAQVGEVIRSLAQHLPQRPKVSVVFGGVSINPQMMSLRGGAEVVVATPGRLLDLVDHNALKLGAVSLLVLDEADRLLDLGFADELNRVLALLPAQRQNLFFSATFARRGAGPGRRSCCASRCAWRWPTRPTRPGHHPARHRGGRAPAHPAAAPPAQGRARLAARAGVCGHQVRRRSRWPTSCTAPACSAEPFHGLLSQGKRQQVLQEFRDERVGGGGLHRPGRARHRHCAQLPVVVNLRPAALPTDHVHRIGRTGPCRRERPGGQLCQRRHRRPTLPDRKTPGPRERIDGFEPTDVAAPPAPDLGGGNGGIKGKRPSKKDKLRAAAAAAAAGGGGT
jgi:ATP-dependent RNA helicase RhlE